MPGRGIKSPYRYLAIMLSLSCLLAGPVIGPEKLIIAGAGLLPADGVTYREDYNRDGSTNIADVIALLLLARADPADSTLDYNGDGVYAITDAIQLLLNIRDGKLTPIEEEEPPDTLAPPPTYEIKGTVYCAARLIENVQIILTGNMEATTLTDGNGMYSFTVPDGMYTIVPAEIAGYGFNPPLRNITVSGADRENLDFMVFGFESLP
ncbi:MAG: hypothetical protein U9N45_01335 [Gemmatimonadota bacterium]|nr:hypothetical protein [Gemmatimonadota bacterium]